MVHFDRNTLIDMFHSFYLKTFRMLPNYQNLKLSNYMDMFSLVFLLEILLEIRLKTLLRILLRILLEIL